MYVTHITQYSGIDLKKYKTKWKVGLEKEKLEVSL